MSLIPLERLVRKVLISKERVQFSHIDPYGHLNASKYIEFFLNHRVAAAEDQLECHALDIVKELGVAFVVHNINTQHLSPATNGEWLELASWVANHDNEGFLLCGTISSVKSRRCRAYLQVQFKSVDSRTGKSILMPTSLPSRSTEDLTKYVQETSTYLAAVRGLPAGQSEVGT